MVELVVFQKSGPYPDLVQQTYDPDAREAEVEVEAEVEIEAEKQRQRCFMLRQEGKEFYCRVSFGLRTLISVPQLVLDPKHISDLVLPCASCFSPQTSLHS